MTIRWNALREHFPMVQMVFLIQPFIEGKMHFLNFLKKPRPSS
jgi:hypothetical protein